MRRVATAILSLFASACSSWSGAPSQGAVSQSEAFSSRLGQLDAKATGFSLSLSPGAWKVLSGDPQPYQASDGALAFDFGYDIPTAQQYLYRTSPTRTPAGTLTVDARVLTTATPVFDWRTEPSNTCGTPASVRVFFMVANDWQSYDGRWWGEPDSMLLQTGEAHLSIPLTPDRWRNVSGFYGSQDAARWQYAITHVTDFGLTFGGGCFYGHGVFVAPGTGTAQWGLLRYSVQ